MKKDWMYCLTKKVGKKIAVFRTRESQQVPIFSSLQACNINISSFPVKCLIIVSLGSLGIVCTVYSRVQRQETSRGFGFLLKGEAENLPSFLWKRDDCTLGNAAKDTAAILIVVRLPQLFKVPGSHNQDNTVAAKSTRQYTYLAYIEICHWCYLILQTTFIPIHRGGRLSVHFIPPTATVQAFR